MNCSNSSTFGIGVGLAFLDFLGTSVVGTGDCALRLFMLLGWMRVGLARARKVVFMKREVRFGGKMTALRANQYRGDDSMVA